MTARELKQMLTARFQSGCTKPPLVAICCERRVAGRKNTFLMVASVKEMAGAASYYLCFPAHSASPNGICLKLNNSSIKRQVRNNKLNTRPFRPASRAERWNFGCLRLKAHSSRWKWKRMRRARERGRRKIVGGGKTKEAQEQDRGGRQSKWQLHCK